MYIVITTNALLECVCVLGESKYNSSKPLYFDYNAWVHVFVLAD